jgi:hypothetical protein
MLAPCVASLYVPGASVLPATLKLNGTRHFTSSAETVAVISGSPIAKLSAATIESLLVMTFSFVSLVRSWRCQLHCILRAACTSHGMTAISAAHAASARSVCEQLWRSTQPCVVRRRLRAWASGFRLPLGMGFRLPALWFPAFRLAFARSRCGRRTGSSVNVWVVRWDGSVSAGADEEGLGRGHHEDAFVRRVCEASGTGMAE